MKFGVREICDVVLKAKATQKVGKKIFYKNEPVIYFDTLKTSSLEGAATQVYATGGRGNARLISWEGERTVTFTMEDALISPEGFMILSGAGLIEASANNTIKQHLTERVDQSKVIVDNEAAPTKFTIRVSEKPYLPDGKGDNFAYVMFVKNDEIISEPYIPVHYESQDEILRKTDEDGASYYEIVIEPHDDYYTQAVDEQEAGYILANVYGKYDYDSVIVDYYTERAAAAQQIEITADKFGGNYYLEASTLFRDQNGVDMPAEFIIPNCKIQSNFTFTMASTGDPSTFTFTMDAFPDYTRFDHSKKVLAAIQIIEEGGSMDLHRLQTAHTPEHELTF